MASTTAPSVSSGNEAWPSVIVPLEALPQPSLRDVIRIIPIRSSRILPAWIMLGACIVISGGMLAAFAYMTIREGFSTDLVEFAIWGPLFTSCAVTGLLILQKYPGHRVGWVVSLAGLVWILAHGAQLYGLLGMTYPDWGLPADVYLLQTGFFYPFGLYLLLVELPLVFPTGRLAGPWWQVARVGGFAGAALIAKQVGIDDVRAGLLPEDKLRVVESVVAQERRSGHTVIMVGDGINDAPALERADIGVAIGKQGGEVAVEAADIVLLGDQLGRLTDSIRIGRAVMRIAGQGIWFGMIASLSECSLPRSDTCRRSLEPSLKRELTCW